MANLYDKASLVQIPSGYKDGKLYNIKPFDQPFEFERGSAATRVNEDGLIEYAGIGEELASNVTITDRNGAIATMDGLNLSASSDGTGGSSIRPKIEFDDLVDGETYLITFSNIVTTGTIGFSLYNGSSYEFSQSSEIPSSYIFTKNGITPFISFDGNSVFTVNFDISLKQISNDTPRIDYTNGKALLLEPQRTNKIEQSEDFTDVSVWNTNNGSVSLEGGYLAPDGSNNAYKITQGSNKTSALLFSGTGGILGTDVRSIWARTTSGTGQIDLCSHDLNTNNNFTVTEEWQRFEVNGTTSGAGATNFYAVDFRGGSSNLTEVIVWGAQSEEGSYATSYIPTNGSAETRLGDACFLQNADVYPNSEGTIFFEIGNYNTNTSANGFNKLFHLDEVGTSNLDNVIYLEEYQGENSILLRKDGNLLLQSTPNYQDLRGSKIIIKWDSEGAKIFINGAINGVYVGDASLDIQYFGFHNPYNGNVVSTIKMKQLVCFPTTLSDDECINLTTI